MSYEVLYIILFYISYVHKKKKKLYIYIWPPQKYIPSSATAYINLTQNQTITQITDLSLSLWYDLILMILIWPLFSILTILVSQILRIKSECLWVMRIFLFIVNLYYMFVSVCLILIMYVILYIFIIMLFVWIVVCVNVCVLYKYNMI